MKIFIAPMDWGLGHATRCIPIIRLLLAEQHTVILGGEGRSLALLRATFPQLAYYALPPYHIHYSASQFQIPTLLLQVPHLLQVFKEEHKLLAEIIDKEKMELVISDNRYGLWTKKVPCIYLTHQIAPLAPFRKVVYSLQKKFLQHFDEIWIPDEEGQNNLSGSLSQLYALPPNTFFIGALSRFAGLSLPEIAPPFFKLTAILSGPEPQRSLLEEKLIQQATLFPQYKFQIIQGKTEQKNTFEQENITFHSFMTETELLQTFANSEMILSRSGYSSLLDYSVLGLKKVILIPTPGQTEQEYLGERLAKKKITLYAKQSQIDFAHFFGEIGHYEGFSIRKDKSFEEKIKQRLNKII